MAHLDPNRIAPQSPPAGASRSHELFYWTTEREWHVGLAAGMRRRLVQARGEDGRDASITLLRIPDKGCKRDRL